MAISTNQKPTIYRNLYENTGTHSQWQLLPYLLVVVVYLYMHVDKMATI